MTDIPDAMLVIAGDGPLSDQLHQAARVVGDGCAARTGADRRDTDIYAMRRLRVPVTFEGRPLALLEAATRACRFSRTPIPKRRVGR